MLFILGIMLVRAQQCPRQFVDLQPYNNYTNSAQIFTNNVIGIGTARMSLSHQLYGNATLIYDYISDVQYTGEPGIYLAHSDNNTRNFNNRIESTLSFSAPVGDLKFTMNDIDAGDHIRLMVYDQDNNLITISSSNYTFYPNTRVEFGNVSGSSGEFREKNDADNDNPNNDRRATVDLNFTGLYVTKIVFQYYDYHSTGSYTITKFSGIDGNVCPPLAPCNAGTDQVQLSGSTLTN